MSGEPLGYPGPKPRREIEEPDPNLLVDRFKYAAMRLGKEGVLFPERLNYAMARTFGVQIPCIVYVMGPDRYYSQPRHVT